MDSLTVMVKPVSGACNMRCRYCFYTDVMAHRETPIYRRMRQDQLDTLVRRALGCADRSVSFAFQGGEPTLAGADFFAELVRLQKAYNTRGLSVSNAVQTNGLDLSDELIDLFVRENFLLGVSLDGDRQTHDEMRLDAEGRITFDRVIQTIRRLRSAGARFNILCVVNEYVARRPREVFEALKEYGYLQFIACLDGFDGQRCGYSLTEASYARFLKTTFDLYYGAFRAGRPVSVRSFDNYIGILLGRAPENCAMCGRCGQYFLVESDLSVYPCDFYVLDEWKLGNLAETSFARLARSDVGARFRDASLRVPPACDACPYFSLCRNGCKRERTPEGVNRWCACYRDFFDYAYARMRDMARAVRANNG